MFQSHNHFVRRSQYASSRFKLTRFRRNPEFLEVVFKRPDKLCPHGLRTLGSVGNELYASQKQQAKAELTYIREEKKEKAQVQLCRFNSEVLTKNQRKKDYHVTNKSEEGINYWLNFKCVHNVKWTEPVGKGANPDRITLHQILAATYWN